MISRPLPSSAGVMKKPSATMNTSSALEATPGSESGKYTRQKDCPPRAPRELAARLRFWSMLRITASMVTMASGMSACTMPIITPAKL